MLSASSEELYTSAILAFCMSDDCIGWKWWYWDSHI